ncbi:MAG: hypothetical protein AB1793_07650 [Candidatus Thermoplasmatota archaeon]
MVENIFESKWFVGQVEKEADREYLSNGERIGEAVAIAASLLMVAFFAIHQTRPTGFFTNDSAAPLAYLVIVYGMVPSAVRMLLGRRNIARPLEAIGMLIFLVVSVYLLVEFPFDMSRFAQPLPHSMEFLLDWIPASLVKWVLGIGAAACAFFGPYTLMLYPAVKKVVPTAEEVKGPPKDAPSA